MSESERLLVLTIFAPTPGNQDPKQTVKIPIRGLAVGNGFNSPCDQVPLSPAMTYQMGLISEKEKAEVRRDLLQLSPPSLKDDWKMIGSVCE